MAAWLSGARRKGIHSDRTGLEIDVPDREPTWSLPRVPLMLETSLPGVFAVGDVRSGSVKRVASAVGEGAISVSLVHRVLAEL